LKIALPRTVPAASRRTALRLLVILAPALLGPFAQVARAHPFVDDRLLLLNEQIAADPDNGRLRLSRGSLLLDEHRAHAALADFRSALELDPVLSIVHLLSAQALLADGQLEPAVAATRRYLELEPASAKGWRTLARALDARSAAAGAGVASEALEAFDRYFELALDPRPDDFLERADLQRRAGRFPEAVRGLEAGVSRLGPITALLRTQLEIERQRGDLNAALACADRLVAATPQKERWLIERARLLADLGRVDEARAALLQAEAALALRPGARQSAPALTELTNEIDRLEAELAAPPGPAGRN
jgi:predicted Zn-dependent protease